MTSEEIKAMAVATRAVALECHEASDFDGSTAASLRAALLEVAYQLAVANERANAGPSLSLLCLCGHPLRDHERDGACQRDCQCVKPTRPAV